MFYIKYRKYIAARSFQIFNIFVLRAENSKQRYIFHILLRLPTLLCSFANFEIPYQAVMNLVYHANCPLRQSLCTFFQIGKTKIFIGISLKDRFTLQKSLMILNYLVNWNVSKLQTQTPLFEEQIISRSLHSSLGKKSFTEHCSLDMLATHS